MTKEDILGNAMELFRTESLYFTMQQLAEHMHISKKTLYRFYASKDDMLADMLEYAFANIHRRKRELLEQPGTYLEKIRRVTVALPDEYMQIDFSTLDAFSSRYPELYRRLLEHLNTGWEPTVRLIEEAKEAGAIRAINTDMFRLMVTATIEALLSGRYRDGKDYKDRLEAMIDLLVYGMEKR